MRSRVSVSLFALLLVMGASTSVAAQGKGNSHKTSGTRSTVVAQDKGGHKAKGTPPGHTKRVTVDDGIRSARIVLVEKGYVVSRVETIRGTRTIYYYRGNMGRGRGHGPLQKMVIRPNAERVVVEGGSPSLVAQVRARLGM